MNKAFNDSISHTSLGEIMSADTMLMNENSTLIGTIQYSYMFLSPASNIEANMQLVGQIILGVRATGATTLSSAQISALQVLANKCPYQDGIGVYQARTLLAYYDSSFTLYNDAGCSGSGGTGHRHEKRNNSTVNTDTMQNISANIYPNPNNGNFTLTYQLQNGQTGRLELYDEIGEKVGEYLLNSQSGTMTISNPNLNQGIYFYKVYTDDGVKKVGKISIIK